METPTADRDEIRRALRLLIAPGAVTEMRVFEAAGAGTVSGYFDNMEALVEAAMVWSGKAPGVYVIPNRVNPDLLARAANRAKQRARLATSDADIIERRWLLVDFDPVRPSGISANAEEHAAAIARAGECRAWLASLGWPRPLTGDSGNGGHLAYLVRGAADEANRALQERILKTLAERFSDDRVKVDVTTCNAARIWRVYGTANCKGDSTTERPHRLARILDAPEILEPVQAEQIAALWPEAAPPEAEPAPVSAGGHLVLGTVEEFDLARWIADHHLDVKEPRPYQDGQRWVFNRCPWNEAHQDNAAYIVQLGHGGIAAGCHHNGCAGKDWFALRDAVEPGWREKRPVNTTGYSSNGDEYGSLGNSVNSVNVFPHVQIAFPRPEWALPIPFREHPVPPFPADTLPPWMAEWVTAEAVATQTPADLAGLLVLAAAAAAVAGKVRIVVRPGWVEPANLFVAVAMASGTRKTVVFDDATHPLDEYEHWFNAEQAAALARAEAEHDILRGRLEKAKVQAAKREGDEASFAQSEALRLAEEVARAKVPRPLKLLADDCTPERLATLLMEQEGRMAVMSDEGGIFDIMAGRYSAAGTPNLDVYLKGHAGSTLRVERVGRPAEYVRHPALTLGLAVQPEVVQGLAKRPGFRGRGLVARFLYAIPPSDVGRRVIEAPTMPDVIREAYEQNLSTLLVLAAGEGKDNPHLLTFSPEARHILNGFCAWIEPQLASFGPLDHMRDWGSKLAGAVARIAGILELALQVPELRRTALSDPWTPISLTIRPDAVQRAVGLGLYLLPHAMAAYAELGADPVVQQARHVLAWLDRTRPEVVSRRELFRALQRRFEKVTDMDPALDLLIGHGYLRLETPPPPSGSGRPASQEYRLNPRSFMNMPENVDTIDNIHRAVNETAAQPETIEGVGS